MTRFTNILLVLGALTLVVAACTSSSGGASPEIKPIESILASEISIEPDLAGTSVTFEVDTTIPVACSVIYGTDESFGSIAVDNDMQGGAHQNHGPLLTGLSPDTKYTYILQGSDAAGTIYRSNVMTFITPPAAESTLGTNIATTATVTGASSEFSDAFAATNAIDGDLATEWSTAGDGDNAWIEIDLGRDQPITSVAYRTREMTDGSAITETFTITIDGMTLGPFATSADPVVLDKPTSGQILRIDTDRTTGGNTGASEIEIYRQE